MATTYKRLGQKYWHCAFYGEAGRRYYRTTGETVRRKAKLKAAELEAAHRSTMDAKDDASAEIYRLLEDAAELAAKKSLTTDLAREMLATIVRA